LVSSVKSVSLAVSTCYVNDLAAYGAVLSFGRHHKELSACFPSSIHPENTVLMEGTIAALQLVSRPCNISVITTDGFALHRHLQSTPFPHLRGELSRLEKIHMITWESCPTHKDVVYCKQIAEKAVGAYKVAADAALPCLGIIRRTMELFGVGLEARVSVEGWVKKSEDGTDEWTEPVEISVLRVADGEAP